ncbi:signal peptidase I [Glutamicibacter sp. ZJUTW]|uniref:signal peptidase I n=1 Tax=Glutamicibacter sp. ZJUTW TaxID=1155384 RepID=UPI0011F23CC2|nr:signal peptidase I [Glutamicibacter sp. ZJUTW]QEP08381.1 signal peptidase I [Glutamicibacter sp. ZJUTW]
MANKNRNELGTRKRNRVQNIALNGGAIIGSLCLLMTLAALLFGLKPLVFASGSMGPVIPTGSLGLAVPTQVEDIAVGDVVSVVTSDEVRVTHRVAEMTEAGLILKGDANPVADLQPYAVDSVDKLLASVPFLGYVVTWLSQPWAYFLGGLLCAYLLYVAFGNDKSVSNGKSDSAGHSGTPVFLGAAMVVSLATAAIHLHPLVEPTHAAFSSTAKATSSLQGAVMQPAKILSCSNRTAASNNKVIDFRWQAPSAQNASLAGYKVSVQINDGEEKLSSLLPASTTTYAVDISRSNGLLGLLIDLLGNLLGTTFNVNFRVYAEYDNGWTSAPSLYSNAKGSITLLGLDRTLRCS